jgi:hypothetical protein
VPDDSEPKDITVQTPAATARFSGGSHRAFTSAGFPWLVAGYQDAFRRFRVASEQEDREPLPVFIPLFETLAWFDSIDEWLKMDGKRIGEKNVRALRYARRRIHHQWADALRVHEYSVTMALPPIHATGTTFDWYWKAADNLPATLRIYAHQWKYREAQRSQAGQQIGRLIAGKQTEAHTQRPREAHS